MVRPNEPMSVRPRLTAPRMCRTGDGDDDGGGDVGDNDGDDDGCGGDDDEVAGERASPDIYAS